MENWKKGKLAITAACAVLGFMLAVQFHSVQKYKTLYSSERAEDLILRLNDSEKMRRSLAAELDEIRKNGYTEGVKKEQEQLRSLAGLTAVEGPGIRIILDDSKQAGKTGENANLYIIHDEDLLKVINELRASGAEAIAVNEQRLIATSEIRCVGPTLLVNDVRYSPPYEITAIGDPKTMESALKLRGGVAETLKFYGIEIQIRKEDALTIPAYKGNFQFDIGKPVEEVSKT